MKMVSKLMLILLIASLALPASGFAGKKAEKKHAKPVVTAPADCKMKSTVLADTANDKRRQTVTERTNSGQIEGAKVEHSAKRKND